MDMQKLRLDQVSRALKGARIPARPSGGWINAVRTALGMTTGQLAERLSISQSTVVAMEKSEAEDRITLQSLRRAAAALDCELQYVLVPRTPLPEVVNHRAEVIARNQAARVFHTMRLEAQESTEEPASDTIAMLKNEVLRHNWKNLWRK